MLYAAEYSAAKRPCELFALVATDSTLGTSNISKT